MVCLCIICDLNQFGTHLCEIYDGASQRFLCVMGQNKIGGKAEYGDMLFVTLCLSSYLC